MLAQATRDVPDLSAALQLVCRATLETGVAKLKHRQNSRRLKVRLERILADLWCRAGTVCCGDRI
jgi:hypothetical protein